MRVERLTLASLVLLIVASGAFGQNLLQNPGFEDAAADGQAAAWVRGGDSDVIADETIARSGERCGRARFDDALAQQVAIEPGGSYLIAGWIRRAEAGGAEVPKIKVYFLTPDGQRASVAATEFPGVPADGWLRWESIMRAPENARIINLTLRGFFGGSEWFYWDDLSVERVEAPDWPAWDKTPDLDDLTVTVPDLADVWTDALLRIPPASLTPIDGKLGSSALSRGHDFRVEFGAETPINYVLVHAMQPLQNLRNARVVGIGTAGKRELFTTGGAAELVSSERFDATPLHELRIEIPADQTVCMTEIQAFGLGPKSPLPGEGVILGLGPGEAPEGMAEHLTHARAKESDRRVLIGGGGAGRGTLSLEAGCYINILATPMAGEYGVGSVEMRLGLSSEADDAAIEISMMQADELDLDINHAVGSDRGADVLARMTAEHQYQREYATIFRAVSQVGRQKNLSVSFDIPDTLYAAGEPVWLVLRPRRDMVLDMGAASSVIVNALTSDQTMGEYLPRLERLLRRLYSNHTEAHAWSDYQEKFIGRYIARVLALAPENAPANLIYNHVAGRRSNVQLARPGPADAPDWAVWSHLALQNMHAVPMWWLDNRQQADGQLAGHINDDGEFSDRWPTDYLITGEPRILDGLQKLADVAWRMSGDKGYTVGSRDVEHAAEDQSCTQPQVLLTRYGSPKAVERLMKMSWYVDFWTAINDVGRRQFKSFMFTSDQIWGDPPNDIDQAYCPLALVGTGHAVWYANLPDLRRMFLEEADSWRLATESTDKGKRAGVIPGEVRFSNSEVLPYMPYNKSNPVLKNRPVLYIGGGIYIIQHLLSGASWLTGDDKYAAATRLDDPTQEEQVAAATSTLAEYTREVPPPAIGPEKRYTMSAGEATEVEAPLRAVREGAMGATVEEGQAGAATFTVSVPEDGQYAIRALVGRTDPEDTSTEAASFFVDMGDHPLNRLRGRVGGENWREVVTSGAYELKAGEHTFRLRMRTAGSAVKEAGFTTAYTLDGSWTPSQSEDRLYNAWRITGDRSWLIEELREVVRQQERSRWLATEAEPYTDRVRWAGERLLGKTYLGETTGQKSHVPGNWISWEGGGTQFAGLVVDKQLDRLKVLCYSFADRPLEMKMRVWRMPHGRYTVKVGIDRDNDWMADESVSEGERELARFDAVEFSAQPGTQYVIELDLIEKLDDITSRADLAMDPWDVSYADGTVTAIVHNIGGAPAPATTVQVMDASGAVVGQTRVPALEAPLDLKPRTIEVSVTVTGQPQEGWRVTVDPGDAIAEITEVNNTMPVR